MKNDSEWCSVKRLTDYFIDVLAIFFTGFPRQETLKLVLKIKCPPPPHLFRKADKTKSITNIMSEVDGRMKKNWSKSCTQTDIKKTFLASIGIQNNYHYGLK